MKHLKHENINTYTENIQTHITEMAKTQIPNKTVKVRPSGSSSLATHILIDN